MGLHLTRVYLARPLGLVESGDCTFPSSDEECLPHISILIAAKNEESVVENLVKGLSNLDYPADRYDFWVINDNSADRTGELLDRLALTYPQLNAIHRGAGASGGKSGALNQALPLTDGEIIAVFDADAQLPRDLLRQVVPLFNRDRIGAVQVRKATANAETNFLTQGQAAEMIFDSFLQEQRIAAGGIGELRGNGQFVRRRALERCGGWNEETITDDLDMTLRLHLDGWDTHFLSAPPVKEEGVERAIALWHQRNRWAEGGYQRYLDYWRLILRNRLGRRKTFDLAAFWIFQYFLPTAAIPDLFMAVLRSRLPIFGPLTGVVVAFSTLGMFLGLRRVQKLSLGAALWQTLRGTLYMFHWFVVVASTTARISVRPKRLKWVKTVHQGSSTVQLDAS